MSIQISIASIRLDGGTQPRAAINPATVDEYRADMMGGATFPPVTVFFDGSDYWLADGFHRVQAARQLNETEIAADIHQGTRRDAILYSIGANAAHGVRRTNEDKRRAVMTLLNDSEWQQWSDNEISRRAGVSQPFVSELRKHTSYNGYKMAERNGSTYTMNTANIGSNGNHAPAPVIVDDYDDLPETRTIDPATGEIFTGDDDDVVPFELSPMSQNGQPSMAKKAYKNSSESNEWYTPRYLIDKAIAVMGGIDLDPATSETANRTVQAAHIYTIEDDALTQNWFGRIWINPPYGRDVDPFVEKLVNEYGKGSVKEALMLVAARTDTAWFRRLRPYPRCFLWGRIKFINGETGEIGDPAGFPSMVVYMGADLVRFAAVFEDIGDIYIRWQ